LEQTTGIEISTHFRKIGPSICKGYTVRGLSDELWSKNLPKKSVRPTGCIGPQSVVPLFIGLHARRTKWRSCKSRLEITEDI